MMWMTPIFLVVATFCQLSPSMVIRFGLSDLSQPVASFFGVSFTECTIECRTRRRCRCVSYHRYTHRCMLQRYQCSHSNTLQVEHGYVVAFRFDKICNVSLCAIGQSCESTEYNIQTKCIYRDCGEPPLLKNALTYGNMITIGSKVLYQCSDDTYYKYESMTTVCQLDGSWSKIKEFCFKTEGVYLNTGHFSEILVVPNFDACFALCMISPYYMSANYKFGKCELTSAYIDEDDNGIAGTTENEGSEVILKPFPVYYSIGDMLEKQSLTFEAAQQYCSSRNTIIASFKDVSFAHEDGFNKCGCGWVAEGYAVTAMQYPDQNCYNTIRVTPCSLDYGLNTFDVFCENPYFQLEN